MTGSLQEGLQTLFIQMVPFLMAVVFHEFAHGFMAARFGDETAKNSGRLTLNPLPHIDPIGTLLFPMVNMLSGTGFLIGWAKPVPINPNRFTKYRPGLFWVSFAGPLMNFLLAFLAALSCYALQAFVPADFYLFEPLVRMAFVSVPLNFALGIFNLIPLPPLDGSKMVQSVLSYNATQKYESIAQYSFWILMGLLISGALSVMRIPIHGATVLTLNLAATIFNMPSIGY
jgi:Zn-dependent protease